MKTDALEEFKVKTETLEKLFMGMQGQNADRLKFLAMDLVESTKQWRDGLSKKSEAGSLRGSVPTAIAEALAEDKEDELKRHLGKLLIYLQRSVPIFSAKYHAHMGWDLLIPGILGSITGTLYNSNNVAYEGSPATSILEKLACDDLCRMLGYTIPEETSGLVRPWGHLVAGGSVANIEAMWAARNLKFIPLTIRAALREFPGDISRANGIEVTLRPEKRSGDGTAVKRAFSDLDAWEILNLEIDEILALPGKVKKALGLKEPHLKEGPADRTTMELDAAIERNGLNTRGIHHFLGQGIRNPRILLSHDNHYSFEKAPALLGLGQDCLEFIEVDEYGRMNLKMLEERLSIFLKEKIPVLAVVANLGSIELGAVDPIAGILQMRQSFRERGLDFMLHVDGAFGGYHASMLRPDFAMGENPRKDESKPKELSDYVFQQYRALPEADSITVDPHKLGFIPFPAGGIFYRNSATRDLIRFSAPYLGDVVSQGISQVGKGTDQLMGVYGVEGSRPGGAASAVFLANCMVRPSQSGYGILSQKEMENTRKIFKEMLALNSSQDRWTIATSGVYPEDLPDGGSKVSELGPDMNMLCYLFNFKEGDAWNQDLLWMNVFNMCIYPTISLNPREGEEEGRKIQPYGGRKLIVTNTIFSGREGLAFIKRMLSRLKMEAVSDMGKPDPDLADSQLFVLRSAKWHPWLDTGDFLNFSAALSEAATGAIRSLELARAGVEKKPLELKELRELGHSSFSLAMGITFYLKKLGPLAEQKVNQDGIGKKQIREGWEELKRTFQIPSAADEALRHFFKN